MALVNGTLGSDTGTGSRVGGRRGTGTGAGGGIARQRKLATFASAFRMGGPKESG
jgi:hypothetical protein